MDILTTDQFIELPPPALVKGKIRHNAAAIEAQRFETNHGHTNARTNYGQNTTQTHTTLGQNSQANSNSWNWSPITHGMRKIRHKAAATEAQRVFAPTGRFLVESYDSIKASTPVLAAVSPNRDIGPWISAGPTPR